MIVTGKRLLWVPAIALLAAAPRVPWDQLTSTGPALQTLAVGEGPEAVIFDGAHIWVANQFDNTLTKIGLAGLNAVGTFKVGQGPIALAFDGSAIWVANLHGNTVMKI